MCTPISSVVFSTPFFYILIRTNNTFPQHQLGSPNIYTQKSPQNNPKSLLFEQSMIELIISLVLNNKTSTVLSQINI